MSGHPTLCPAGPGVIDTDIMERVVDNGRAMLASFGEAHPIGRTGTPEEVAEVIVVIGAGPGVGAAIARQLDERGIAAVFAVADAREEAPSRRAGGAGGVRPGCRLELHRRRLNVSGNLPEHRIGALMILLGSTWPPGVAKR
jgi:NAD(P)-dependent dehydrogenase (short-subunit alcohol dehydrogenase family)